MTGGDSRSEHHRHAPRWRCDRLVRLFEVRQGGQTRRYITNVRDPRQLSARQALDLYHQRCDIALALELDKTDLGLHLLWSAKWNVLMAQIWDVLIIAQIALFTQREVADWARVTSDEVSLSLLVKFLPERDLE